MLENRQGESHEVEIEARVALALARANSKLTGSEADIVRDRIARSIEHRHQLRTLSLENQDEPAHGFDLGFLSRPGPREDAP